MNETKRKKVKLGLYIFEDEREEIRKMSSEMNMTISTLSTVLIKLGLQVVKVSKDPSMIEYFNKMDLDNL